MLSHTVKLNGRNPHDVRFDRQEAVALLEKGFRFSIFDPHAEQYRLSIPYQLGEDRVRDTLTFMQDDE